MSDVPSRHESSRRISTDMSAWRQVSEGTASEGLPDAAAFIRTEFRGEFRESFVDIHDR